MAENAFGRVQQVVLVIARIALAYLFFTQLFWKLPPTFGCPSDFKFTTGTPGQLKRTSGLCDWVGLETVWSDQPRPFFVTDMRPAGGPRLAVDLGFLASLNGAFLKGFVQPNIRWFGWVVWGMEAFIFLTLSLGLFSRLGGLVAIFQSAQLMIGLAGISNPAEWEWSYNLMVVLSLVVFAYAPGRVFGLDAFLRPRIEKVAERGNRVSRALLWLL